MGWFINLMIISALASFIIYNMDQVNKMGADIRFVKNQLTTLIDGEVQGKIKPLGQ